MGASITPTLTRRNADLLAKGQINIHAIMEVPRGLKQAEIRELTRDERLRQNGSRAQTFAHGPRFPPGRLAIHFAAKHAEAVKVLQEAMAKVFKDPEFHKEYLKLVAKAELPVLPEEMEKLVKELPRDPEIVALFKKINDAESVNVSLTSGQILRQLHNSLPLRQTCFMHPPNT